MKKQILGSILLVVMSLIQMPHVWGASQKVATQGAKGLSIALLGFSAGLAGQAGFSYFKSQKTSVECLPDVLKLHTGEEIPWNYIINMSMNTGYENILGSKIRINYCILELYPKVAELIKENKKLSFPKDKKPNEVYIAWFDVDAPLATVINTFLHFRTEFEARKKDPKRVPLAPVRYKFNRNQALPIKLKMIAASTLSAALFFYAAHRFEKGK